MRPATIPPPVEVTVFPASVWTVLLPPAVKAPRTMAMGMTSTSLKNVVIRLYEAA